MYITVGLKYNTNWKSLASSPSGEGLHTGPPGFEFIIFPNVLKSIEFSSLRVSLIQPEQYYNNLPVTQYTGLYIGNKKYMCS